MALQVLLYTLNMSNPAPSRTVALDGVANIHMYSSIYLRLNQTNETNIDICT